MMPSEQRSIDEEIKVLKGGLSAATMAIGLALGLINQLAGAEIQKAVLHKIDEADGDGNDLWREGVDRFKKRLAETLSKHSSTQDSA